MKHEQIRIISDGTPYGTKVLNSDGAEIPGITSIKISISIDTLCTAVVEFTDVMLEMSAIPAEANETTVSFEKALWQLHPLKQWANRRTGKNEQ